MRLPKTALLIAGLVWTSLSAGIAQAQQIVLYDLPNFGGQSITINGYERNLDRIRFNDRASSVRVISGDWRLCQHTDMGGFCETISTDRASIGRLNNQLTSLRPVTDGGHGGDYGGGTQPGYGNDERLTLYSGPNFTGQALTLDGPEINLDRLNFNDRARSIRYNGNRSWRVCQHPRFEGACLEVSGDVPVIGGGMAGQISSAEPDVTNRSGDRPREGVWLYAGQEFVGQRFDVTRDIANLSDARFNDQALSLVMAPGERWEVCEDASYRGRCEYFNGDIVANLNLYGLGNRVSSLRRVNGSNYGGGYGRESISGGVRAVDATFYARPEINGYGIARCLDGFGRDCDEAAANRICRIAGHERAEYFAVERYSQARTWSLDADRACYGGQCAPIVNLVCAH